MRIGTSELGRGQAPFVVAELSANHGGVLERALRIIEAAARAGAQAVKLQTFTAESMTLDSSGDGFVIEDPASLWSGRRLFDLYREAETPWEWHAPIMHRARDLGIECFSSAFDLASVAFLDDLEMPCIKIASLENGDLELIGAAAATGRPLIISTGASTLDEIDEAVSAARDGGCQDLVLLQCTSGYPAPIDQANLLALQTLRDRYGCEVGLSDHTRGIGVAAAATALGAVVIEKHVTDRRADGGVDAAFSAEPEELAALVAVCREAADALGVAEIGPTPAELSARVRRRSLFVAHDLQAGDVLSREDVQCVRPALGLPPKHLDAVLGHRLLRPVAAGTPLDWSLIDTHAPLGRQVGTE